MNKVRKSIPSWFTAGNLLLGVASIVFSARGEMTGASICIFLAVFLDFFDGFVARLLKAESLFGKEFDSLADTITSGVAPSLLLFYLAETFNSTPLRYTAFLLSLFAAIRLAKFNIDTRQSVGFIGLPTPAMSILVASFPLILEFSDFNLGFWLSQKWFVPVFSICLSYLMVSPLPLFSLKFKDFTWQHNRLVYLFLILCVAILIGFQFLGIPIIILLYLLLSVMNKFAL